MAERRRIRALQPSHGILRAAAPWYRRYAGGAVHVVQRGAGRLVSEPYSGNTAQRNVRVGVANLDDGADPSACAHMPKPRERSYGGLPPLAAGHRNAERPRVRYAGAGAGEVGVRGKRDRGHVS